MVSHVAGKAAEKADFVLILIVMDNGLSLGFTMAVAKAAKKVLILIVMDNGLSPVEVAESDFLKGS